MRTASLFIALLFFAAPVVLGTNLRRGQEAEQQVNVTTPQQQQPQNQTVVVPAEQRVPPANATTNATAGAAAPLNATVNATDANSTKHSKF